MGFEIRWDTPLTWSKHKGKTPRELFNSKEDASFLKWALEKTDREFESDIVAAVCKKFPETVVGSKLESAPPKPKEEPSFEKDFPDGVPF